MSKITIGNEIKADGSRGRAVELDLHELTEYRLLVQGGSGSGKTHTLCRIIEQCYGKVQVIVLDREGDFVALREHFDFVIAGKGRDIPADPAAAELLAHKALELQFPLIVDLFEHRQRDREIFAKRFLEALTEAPERLWHPVLVVIDEADEFAPERSEGVSESTREVADIAKRGRKRGFTILIGTQRISAVNKTVLSQCRNKMVGFADLDLDVKRSAKSIGLRGEEGENSIQDLERGEFFMKGPALGRQAIKVRVGPIKTDLRRTTAKGAPRHAPPPSATLKKLLKAELTDLAAQSREDLQEKGAMRARITELEKAVRDRHAKPLSDPAHDKVVAQKSYERGLSEGRAESASSMKRLESTIKNVQAHLSKAMAAVDAPLPKITVKGDLRERAQDPPPGRVEWVKDQPRRTVSPGDGKSLSRPARLILNLLMNVNPRELSKGQVAGWTQYSITSSSFANALGELRSQGLVDGRGDALRLLSGAHDAAVTALGRDYDPNWRPSVEAWASKLKRAPRLMFEFLRANAGRAVSKEELSEATGYRTTSSSFANALGDLSSKRLIKRSRDGIQFNEELLEL